MADPFPPVAPDRKPLSSVSEKVFPRWTALLVIDMQNDFVSPAGAIGRAGHRFVLPDDMLGKLVKLIRRARESRVRVVWVKSEYNTADGRFLSDVWLEQYGRQGNGHFTDYPVCYPGTWGWELADGLTIEPADTVVTKHRYSAFVGTDLDLLLRTWGIRTLVIAGVGTMVCVETTVRDAFGLDYYNVVAGDCCWNYEDASHQQALARIDFVFGEVTKAADVESVWTTACLPAICTPAGMENAR